MLSSRTTSHPTQQVVVPTLSTTMARVVDFCPSSDDELPDLNTLLKKPTQKQLKPASASTESPRKNLVPKSASKSVNRKIRRLDSSSQIKGNLLFQRCDPREGRSLGGSILQGLPRKSPLKRRGREAETQGNLFPNESVFGLDDSPPTARACRTRRSRIIPILEDDDSEHESQPHVRIDQLLQVQTPGPRRLQSSQLLQPNLQSNTSLDINVAKQDDPANISTCYYQTNAPEEYSKVEANGDETHTDQQSTCRTAGEGSSSSYSDGSSSESISDKSAESIGNDTDAASLATRAQRAKGKVSSETLMNVLQPRETNSINNGPSPIPHEQQANTTTPSLLDESQGRTREACGENMDTNTTLGLASEFSKLRLQRDEASDEENELPVTKPQTTSPRTPKSEKPKGLTSPTKQDHIPKTPHRPSMDTFWNQKYVDQWNEHHSPRKLILPSRPMSPSKTSPKKEERKTFDSTKQDIAREFLAELDTQITEGKITELAESTGGVKLVWSKTLNTTAGRANWRRETIRTKNTGGAEVDVRHKHHASIELAEKVIDDENRLLNVLAHEFCHLANFMISGVTNNPHGKEFKVWASKCSRTFQGRAVKVTTKHSYEIAFKYVWECSACGSEYKRHSRSIDPQRHRCGSCKGTLKQTKPAQRGGGKPNEYQTFVREQMKTVKEENPRCPQKEIMKIIAAKWAQRSSKKLESSVKTKVEVATADLVNLTLEGTV